jgi:hypothetical protein
MNNVVSDNKELLNLNLVRAGSSSIKYDNGLEE